MVNKKILKTVPFSKISVWSVDSAATTAISSQYPMKPLRKVLYRVKDAVRIQDNLNYRRITVKLYGKGVVQRDEVSGKDIGTKRQFRASAGQLILSRIDARNGAFGIIPEELDGAIVTNDFWLFDMQGVNPEFVMLVLASEQFQKYWQVQSSGTTNRQRIGEQEFLSAKIPFLSLSEQDSLIQEYRNKIIEAEAYEEKVANLEKNADLEFLDTLGATVYTANRSNKNNLLVPVRLTELERWDAWTKQMSYRSTKYRFSKLSKAIIGTPLYGANEKAVKRNSDVRYIRITDINENGCLNNEVVTAEKVEGKYLLQENDFLIARSGNTVGKTFLYKEKYGKCIFAGYLVRYKINTEKIIPEYLLFYTKSSLFKAWIQNNQRLSGQPNINGQEYLNADIIIPEKEVQRDLIEKMELYRQMVRELELKSRNLRTEAKREFEGEVFGEA